MSTKILVAKSERKLERFTFKQEKYIEVDVKG
jgi:hypothetical protein